MINLDGNFSLPDSLKIINQCPLCQGSAKKIEARLLNESSQGQKIFFHCRQCQGSIIALFMMSGNGVTSYGLVTDLNFDDVLKFQQAESIAIDDVIFAHKSLNSGNFLAKINQS